ncbi:MAG: acyl carrier protein [Lachnospiraceae bacterium]|nr:acyl carrier protein [Lachnospiraceae bacterium]
MKERLLDLLKEIQPYEEIDYDTLLVSEGILDSLGLAEFIVALQEEFGVDIPEDMITEENFQTIETIRVMIEKLR